MTRTAKRTSRRIRRTRRTRRIRRTRRNHRGGTKCSTQIKLKNVSSKQLYEENLEYCVGELDEATSHEKDRETLEAKLNKFRLTNENLEDVMVAGDIDGITQDDTVIKLLNKVYSDNDCDIEKTAQFLLRVSALRRISEVAHKFVPFDKF